MNQCASKFSIFLIFLMVGLLSGCNSVPKRAVEVGAGSAAGGAIGYAASNGNPWATVGGAAGGAALTNLVLGDDSQTLQKGFDEGYERGHSDAMKRQYWVIQSLNEASNSGKTTYYSVPVSEVTPDGKNLVCHAITVPIIE